MKFIYLPHTSAGKLAIRADCVVTVSEVQCWMQDGKDWVGFVITLSNGDSVISSLPYFANVSGPLAYGVAEITSTAKSEVKRMYRVRSEFISTINEQIR